ncbi:MAG: HupE/UreJ family protein [Burkholderiales bacterium]
MKYIYNYLIIFSFISVSAWAHKPSDSYLSLKVDGPIINGQWDIALRDLDHTIGLDANNDGDITWGEVKAKHQDLADYAMSHLMISADGILCPAKVTDHLIDNHSDGGYAVMKFSADCAAEPTKLELDYDLFFTVDPQHKGLLNLVYQGLSNTAIFSPDKATQSFDLKAASKWQQFTDYVVHGIQHIWKGFDHVLFLLSLLLPAVLMQVNKKWQPTASFRAAFIDVLKIVTAFTLAHSITLTLATLGVISLPSRFVESTIAASIMLAAANNLWPMFQGKRWVVAFFFGLIHGFGFASVLADLGLPQGALILALVGFNLGVEIGQLAIVSVFLPLAYLARRTWMYQRVILIAGSLTIVALAGTWLIERAFNVSILPFKV